VGEIVRLKLSRNLSILGIGLAALGLLLLGGGGGGKSANVVTVLLTSSSGQTLILGQSTTLTATVSGATNTNVNWTPVCHYTTTTVDSTGKSTTSTAKDCPPDPAVTPADPNHTIFGVFSNQQATTEVFTATSTLPDPKTYPGLVIIATAQSQQDTKKTGTINLSLNSGISLSFTPGTASVPISEPQAFLAQLTNDTGKTPGVTWSLTQNVPDSTFGSVPNPYTPLPTCSPSCGTLADPKANPVQYMAPAAVPTAITPTQKNNPNTSSPQLVTLVAVSNADPTRLAIGTITVVPGGPITFNGISPLFAPQGATFWDIYLDAPNVSSATQIKLSTQPVPKDSNSGQIRILFPVPTSSSSSSSSTTPTCSATTPCSTGARLRLNASDLATAGPVTISITDPAQTCNGAAAGTACSATGIGTFTIQPVRATSTATVPDDIVQGSQTQPFTVTVDGGYFGPNGNSAAAVFQSTSNNALSVNPVLSTSNQLFASLDPKNINPTNPGLYQLFVRSNGSPAPSPNNPSVTNMALFPDYSTTKGAIPKGPTPTPAGTSPSAVDIDPALGILAVAETGSNTVEFFTIGSGTLTSICKVGNAASTCTNLPPVSFNVPTGISVDRNNHTVAVVNYGAQTAATSTSPCQPSGQGVTVLGIPGGPSATTEFSVPLPFDPLASPANALQSSSVCPAPMPYSIGVDPGSHLALVAYSSNSTSSVDNLGFIVNLNADSSATPNSYGCALDHAFNPSSTKVGQCLVSQVTLNTGVYPQVALAPHGHLALVTPGGSGVVRGVDVTKGSATNVVASATLAAGLVTVIIDPTKCPPPLADPNPNATPPTNPCPFSMVPGAAGSVLVTGLTAKTTANNAFFNGVFTVNVTSNVSFTYGVNSTASDTATGGCTGTDPKTKTCSTVFYGQPDQIFGLPSTTQGVAINPITNTAALTDANATGTNGPQVNLLNGLDQTVSSITGFLSNCTAFGFLPAGTIPCPVSPELLATTNVAWQPYTNAVVSYNPKQGLVSISDPVGQKRYALVSGLGPSALSFPVTNGIPNGALTLWGGIAVDPATDQAFVVESGQAANPNVTPPVPATPGQIEIISLTGATSIKSTHVSEVIVPSPTGASGAVGGVPNALVPQATLTCTPTSANTCDLRGVQIFGSGFDSGTQVLLDGTAISGSVQVASPRQLSATIPGALLAVPHHYALSVINGSGAQSNAVDFIVIGQVDLSGVCTNSGSPTNTQPSSVAIADQIGNTFSPFALVSVTGCNDIVQIDLNPPSPTFAQQVGKPISVGTSPEGIAIWQRKGLAVVANNGSNTASVIDLTQSPPGPALCAASSSSGSGTVPCAAVSTGTNPTGVAINEATGAAVTANTGSNTVTMINLGLLFPQNGASLPTSLTPVSIGGIQEPTAVAIDPGRGTNGIAVVSTVQLTSGSAPTSLLAVVDIGQATPALSTTFSPGFVSSTPTGIVFDPAVNISSTNPGVVPGAFFANSSGTNSITEFIPEGGSGSVSVGVNPTSLAINPQTGAMLTANSAGNTISIVDTLSSPFKTRQTLGIPGSPTFGVAIDQFTNLAVIVDQANMRVLLFPMPN